MQSCAPSRAWIQPLNTLLPRFEEPVRQLVTIEFRDRVFTVQTVLTQGPSALTLIGLSSTGQRLFTLHYDGRQVSVESRIGAAGAFNPRWILTDMQLAHAPLATLRTALPDDIEIEQLGTWRGLFRDGKLLWMRAGETDATFDSPTMIHNAVLGYRVAIEPLMLQLDESE